MAFDQKAYINEWKRQNHDVLSIRIPKGNKAKINDAAKQHGMTVVAMVADSLKRCYSIDILEKPQKEEGN